jgi:hypothetical protein
VAHAETNLAIKQDTSNSDAAFRNPKTRVLQRKHASSEFAALSWIYEQFWR